jgi:hypothetical protein
MAQFSVSLDEHFKDQLDAYAEKNGFDRSEALRSILESFFHGAESAEGLDVRQELARLKARIDEVESLQGGSGSQLGNMNVRLDLVQHFLNEQYRYLAHVHEVLTGELKTPETTPPIPLWIDDFPSHPALGSLGYD